MEAKTPLTDGERDRMLAAWPTVVNEVLEAVRRSEGYRAGDDGPRCWCGEPMGPEYVRRVDVTATGDSERTILCTVHQADCMKCGSDGVPVAYWTEYEPFKE